MAALEKDSEISDPRKAELRKEYMDEALRLLEKAARLAAKAGRNFKREIVTAQKDFDAIRNEPGFEAVLKIIDGL